MDIPNLIADFRKLAPEFASSYCIVNGAIMNLNEIQDMGYDEFSFRSKINMPLRLYRYYPNKKVKDKETGEEINYSLQALANNTVFLQSPTAYDDVYDSDINIDYPEYEHLRLIEYCRRCGIEVKMEQSTQEIGDILVKTLWEYYTTNGNLDNVFTKTPDSEIEQLANQIFKQKTLYYFFEFLYCGQSSQLISQSCISKTAGFLFTPIYGMFLFRQISIIFSLSSVAIRLPR